MPDVDYETRIGEAKVCRTGSNVTLVGFGRTLHVAMEAAQSLAARNIDCEVIDLRSIVPIDRGTLKASIEKTGRLIVVDDDYLSFGVTAEILALACELAFTSLRAAPRRIAFPDVPIPFSPSLERPLMPNAEQVIAAVEEQMGAAA